MPDICLPLMLRNSRADLVHATAALQVLNRRCVGAIALALACPCVREAIGFRAPSSFTSVSIFFLMSLVTPSL